MDRISSKISLSRRNIVPDLVCQSCGYTEETHGSHSYQLSCCSKDRSALAIWCKLPTFVVHSTTFMAFTTREKEIDSSHLAKWIFMYLESKEL